MCEKMTDSEATARRVHDSIAEAIWPNTPKRSSEHARTIAESIGKSDKNDVGSWPGRNAATIRHFRGSAPPIKEIAGTAAKVCVTPPLGHEPSQAEYAAFLAEQGGIGDELKLIDESLGALATDDDGPRRGNLNRPEIPRSVRTRADLKDLLHCRLNARCQVDPVTDCWIWLGAWQTETGLGVMRTGGKMFMVSRVAAWVYLGGFDFFDTTIRTEHIDECPNPACFNPAHLVVKGGDHCGVGVRFAERLFVEDGREACARPARSVAPVVRTVAPADEFAGSLFGG